MFTQALNVDIATISKSAKGRVLFFDADGVCVLGLSETAQIQLQFDGGYIYVIQDGGGTGVFNQGGVPNTPMAFNCSFYKFTVVGLTDIDGRPFTALSQPNYDPEVYTAKVREAYEYLVGNIFVGCCNTGTDSILWYADEASFPATGLTDTLYVDKATPSLFIWDGSAYVAIAGGGGGGGVESVDGYSVDNTDPLNPIVKAVPISGTNPAELITGDFGVDPTTSNFRISQVVSGFTHLFEIESAVGSRMIVTQGTNTGSAYVSNNQAALSFGDGTNGSSATMNDSGCHLFSSDGTNNTTLDIASLTALLSSDNPTFEGLKYAADYSANFVLRSLIDLEVLKKRIWTKAGAPTTSDDSTQGYIVGSLIWDTTNSILYKCTDNTGGAAVWAAVIGSPQTIWKNTTDSAAVTGTTTVTKLRSQLIPANTFNVGEVIRIRWRDRKTGTAGNATHSLYVNTSDTITGASLLGFFTQTSTRVSFQGKRDLVIKSSTVTEVADNGTSLVTDDADIQTAFDNVNVDWTVDQYIIFAVNPANAGDSMINSEYIIEQKV